MLHSGHYYTHTYTPQCAPTKPCKEDVHEVSNRSNRGCAMGLGWFATCDIPQDMPIFDEHPVLRIPWQNDMSKNDPRFIKAMRSELLKTT